MDAIDPVELERIRNLPWLSLLDAGDAAQFIAEYEGVLRETYRIGDRRPLDAVVVRWEERSRSSAPKLTKSEETEG